MEETETEHQLLVLVLFMTAGKLLLSDQVVQSLQVGFQTLENTRINRNYESLHWK